VNAAFLAVAAFVQLKNNLLYGFRYATLTALTITGDRVGALRDRISKPILACAAVRSFGAFDVAELEWFSEAIDGLNT